MVIQKTVDSLREKPHEEKKAVATGAAATVVVILMIAWGYWFLNKIQRSGELPMFEGIVPQDQFDYTQLNEQIQAPLYDNEAQLRDIRDSTVQQQGGGSGETFTPRTSPSDFSPSDGSIEP